MSDGISFSFEFDRNEIKRAAVTNPDRAAAIVRGALESATRLALGEIEPKVLALLNERIGPQVTGNLALSFGRDIIFDGEEVVEGRLAIQAPYALPVEEGSRPHWAPLEPLVLWAQRKFGYDEFTAYDMAVNVQRKIAHHGTEGKFFARDGFEQALPAVERIYEAAFDATLEKLATQ